jgi:hypothetical protein
MKRPPPKTIEALRREAQRLGLRLSGDPYGSSLPKVRCTVEERKRADQHAAAAGISLAEYIRRRVFAEAP